MQPVDVAKDRSFVTPELATDFRQVGVSRRRRDDASFVFPGHQPSLGSDLSLTRNHLREKADPVNEKTPWLDLADSKIQMGSERNAMHEAQG